MMKKKKTKQALKMFQSSKQNQNFFHSNDDIIVLSHTQYNQELFDTRSKCIQKKVFYSTSKPWGERYRIK